jgi:hypothetical protein
LQCRPQLRVRRGAVGDSADLAPDRIVFSAQRYVSNGRVPEITHIVCVDADAYAQLSDQDALREVGRVVGRLNKLLPRRQFILIGPGRWGSRGDIRLGVPVTYSDINNSAMLIEVAHKRGNVLPDLSFGTHFFQDLVEASIRYLPLYPDDEGIVFNRRFLMESRNMLTDLQPQFAHLAGVVRVIDVPREAAGLVLRVLMNADLERAVGFLSPPRPSQPRLGGGIEGGERSAEDHSRWRNRMAQRIAAPSVPGAGVAGVPGRRARTVGRRRSDIDLIIHVRGAGTARLDPWLEAWGTPWRK